MNVQHYSYCVFWSEKDQEFVGRCSEFPSLSWLDESQSAALEGIVHLVSEVVVDMTKHNEQPPKPLSQQL